jgi:hypothetical protein
VRRLERRYLAELVARSRSRPINKATGLPTQREPRRLLFISDVRWECAELVPELEKICPVTTLNLQPHLSARMNGQPAPAQIVARTIEDYLSAHRTYEPDLVLFYARSGLLSEEVFGFLRRRWSCPLLGLNLDDKIEFLPFGLFSDRNDNYQQWACHFDLNLSNVRAVVDWYADSGWPAYYMPEGYHPRSPLPDKPPTYRHELSFVGSWRAERDQLCRQLRSAGLPLAVIGHGWANAEVAADPEQVYRGSLMNLGIGFASPSRKLTTLKARDFECPGAGACYLTTYNWELTLHFELDKEILCYRSVEELIELFSYYRRRPEACWNIAQAAYWRCLHEHTWEKRFRQLFEQAT